MTDSLKLRAGRVTILTALLLAMSAGGRSGLVWEAPAESGADRARHAAGLDRGGRQSGGEGDGMYYFEVLNSEKSGWFHPDPATATPYFVVSTAP